jgi:hypothetical protein
MVDISTLGVTPSYLPSNSSVISPHSTSSVVSLQGRGDIPSSVDMKKFTAEQCCCGPDVISSAVEVAFEGEVLERILTALRLFGGDVDQGWRIDHGVLRRWPVATVDCPSDVSGFKSLDDGILESGGDSLFPCEALISFGASLLDHSVDWISLNPVLSSILILLFGFHVTTVSVVFLWILRDFLRCRSRSTM